MNETVGASVKTYTKNEIAKESSAKKTF